MSLSVNLAYSDLTRAHEGFETVEIMYHWLGLCVPWTCFVVWGEGVRSLKLHVPFWGDCCWEAQMRKNWMTIERRNFLKNNSIEDLGPFKE